MTSIVSESRNSPQNFDPTRRGVRFSLTSLLALVTIVALISGFVIQHRRNAQTLAALSRYESEQISTLVPSGKYRVIARTIVNNDHVKVATYRIECRDAFFGELMGRDGDGSGISSRHNPDSGIYFVEWTFVFDHLPTENRLKVSNTGYALQSVPNDFSLNAQLSFSDPNGIHDVKDDVVAFVLNGEPYSLSVK